AFLLDIQPIFVDTDTPGRERGPFGDDLVVAPVKVDCHCVKRSEMEESDTEVGIERGHGASLSIAVPTCSSFTVLYASSITDAEQELYETHELFWREEEEEEEHEDDNNHNHEEQE
ncbi:hypothetical protein BGZ65_005130, partial [Modicella reniformis]